MKIFTVVGIRKSGKTSTVEALIKEINARGKKVGTCKSIFCPGFSIDKPDSNTARHIKAGSAMVCARAKNETTFIRPVELSLSEVAAAFEGNDYLILEGDYLSPVARIVCAHKDKDASERINDLTICCAGRIAALTESAVSLPRYNALEDAAALLDFIDAHVPDAALTPALDVSLPPVPGVTGDGFCQCGCHHNEHKLQSKGITVIVDGKEIKLSAEQTKLVRSWAGENVHE